MPVFTPFVERCNPAVVSLFFNECLNVLRPYRSDGMAIQFQWKMVNKRHNRSHGMAIIDGQILETFWLLFFL